MQCSPASIGVYTVTCLCMRVICERDPLDPPSASARPRGGRGWGARLQPAVDSTVYVSPHPVDPLESRETHHHHRRMRRVAVHVCCVGLPRSSPAFCRATQLVRFSSPWPTHHLVPLGKCRRHVAPPPFDSRPLPLESVLRWACMRRVEIHEPSCRVRTRHAANVSLMPHGVRARICARRAFLAVLSVPRGITFGARCALSTSRGPLSQRRWPESATMGVLTYAYVPSRGVHSSRNTTQP
jgi:hypothetical protein